MAGWIAPAIAYVVLLGAGGVTAKLALRTITWQQLVLWVPIAYLVVSARALVLRGHDIPARRRRRLGGGDRGLRFVGPDPLLLRADEGAGQPGRPGHVRVPDRDRNRVGAVPRGEDHARSAASARHSSSSASYCSRGDGSVPARRAGWHWSPALRRGSAPPRHASSPRQARTSSPAGTRLTRMTSSRRESRSRDVGRRCVVVDVDVADTDSVRRPSRARSRSSVGSTSSSRMRPSHATFRPPSSTMSVGTLLEVDLSGVFRCFRAGDAAHDRGRLGPIAGDEFDRRRLPGVGAPRALLDGKGRPCRTRSDASCRTRPYGITANAIAPGVIETPQSLDPVNSLGPDGVREFAAPRARPAKRSARRTLRTRSCSWRARRHHSSRARSFSSMAASHCRSRDRSATPRPAPGSAARDQAYHSACRAEVAKS